jgi:ATPase subunit of ABC transporter with duplicated ATPase domains
MLLDEPTNDLTSRPLSSLENALLDFPGCVASPARPLVPDRVATHILASEGDSQWFWFEGN